MRERIYKALVNKYHAQMDEALLKIDLLMLNSASNAVMVDHVDITGEIDKLLARAATASERMALLKKYYSTN
jgi:superfamily II helicase